MFKPPLQIRDVYITPVITGLWTLVPTNIPPNYEYSFTLQAGNRLYFPGITLDSGMLYYAGRAVSLWLTVDFLSTAPSHTYTTVIESALNTGDWLLGSDIDGVYVELVNDHILATVDFTPADFVSGVFRSALVFPDNAYASWASGILPPNYVTVNI